MSLAAARDRAREILGRVAGGKDPASEKAEQRAEQRDAQSFENIARLFVDEHVKTKRPQTQLQYEGIIRRYLLPAWSSHHASIITRADIKTLRAQGKDVMANRVIAVTSKLFNWAVEEELMQASPAIRVRKVEENARTRTFSSTEIRVVWKALGQMRLPVAAFFKLCLLTAQRRGEILGMAWEDIDLESHWWTIPATKAKNHRMHRVYMSTPAIEIIGSLRAGAPPSAVYVFSRRTPGGWISELRTLSGVDVRPHDMRRTSATLMTGSGIPKDHVSRILNHTLPGETARVYDQHSYDREKRGAMMKLARIIEDITTGRENDEANVVAIHA